MHLRIVVNVQPHILVLEDLADRGPLNAEDLSDILLTGVLVLEVVKADFLLLQRVQLLLRVLLRTEG